MGAFVGCFWLALHPQRYQNLQRPYLKAMNKLRPLAIAVFAFLAFTSLPAQTVDASFNPNANGSVLALSVQPDGKILVGGNFTTIGGQQRTYIARFHSNGILDASFNPNVSQFASIQCLAVQMDGKILLAGQFSSIDGQTRNGIARLHEEGSLDTSFNPNANYTINTLALQMDGRILIGGEFTTVGGQTRNRIARLNPDGSVDGSFNPDANSTVRSVSVLPDGKVLVGGGFSMMGGQARLYLARLHPDGSVDASFNPGIELWVHTHAVLPDGKILVGGTGTYNTQMPNRVARLNFDGSLDETFANPQLARTQSVHSLALQEDGKIWVAGSFTSIGGEPRQNIALLNADGTVSDNFQLNADAVVNSLSAQPDGRILVGGGFLTVGGQSAKSIARLLNEPATSTLTVSGISQVDWQRAGSAPEIGQVVFESWTGSNWTSVGSAVQIPGGWQATGLSLPSNSWIRGRGAATGGRYNGSSNVIEQITSYGNSSFPKISVTGVGMSPLVSGLSILDFGNVSWRQSSSSQTITITNIGTAPLSTLALHVSGEGADTFSMDALGTTSLAPGENTSFSVHFNPVTDGLRGATLSISSNDLETMPFQIPLQGNGVLNDPSFNPGSTGTVQSIALQADGKILVSGQSLRLARRLANGTLDTYFKPNVNNVVFSIAVQADGKILIGGDFTTVGGLTRNRIARLHPDGSLDESFDPVANSSVRCIVPQADGSILVGGTFTTIGGQGRNRIARLHHDGSLDQSFNPNANDWVSSVAMQPDGKIILGGGFTTLVGQMRSRIARLHPDGSLDVSFDPGANDQVLSLGLQPDGKILLGGSFTSVGGQSRSRIARLLPDGSVDASFNADVDASVSTFAMQANGMILIGGSFSDVGGQPRSRIARIHPDGSPDASFNPGVGSSSSYSVSALALQQDGMILVGGTFTTAGGLPRENLARLLNDTTVSTFSQTAGSQIEWQRNGTTAELGNVSFDYWTAGVWTSAGPVVRVPGGWRATGISLPGNIWIRARGISTGGYGNGSQGIIEQLASYGGAPLSGFEVTGNGGVPIASGQGALDLGSVELNKTSMPQTITITNTGSSPLLDFSHRISGVAASEFITTPPSPSSIASGESTSFTVRFKPAAVQVRSAVLTISFNHPLATAFEIPLTGTGVKIDTAFVPNANDSVRAFGLQADGKIVVGGLFTTIAGQARNRIARLHPDGSLDAAFNPGADERINSIAIQADGKILVSGWFTSLGGQTRNHIARLHPDGSLDESFNPDANGSVSSVAIQPDGMIVIVGRFTTVTGQASNRIARLFPDGSLDQSFNPNAGGAVHAVAFLPDGKIIAAGEFTTIGGLTRNRIALLNTDGSVVSTFNPNANNTVHCLALQPDGKIVIAGDFTNVGNYTRNRIARINANGSLDQSFSASISNTVNSLALQADGKILVGSAVNALGGKPIARLNTNGSIDTNLDHVADQTIYTLMLQANGRILAGGDFTTIDSQPRDRIARLLTYAATSELSVTGGNQIQWLRGGTAPEVDHVLFDYWNGSIWVNAGSPARITGGWQASGLTLPADSWIRARGIARGGYNTGSTGIIEQVAFSGTEQTFASWISYPDWGISGASGDPEADPDGDGIPTLLEYALGGTDPTDRAAGFPVLTSPGLSPSSPQLRITFLRRTGGIETGGVYISGDLIYRPVASTDLGQWNLAPIPVANPPGLPDAPEGFEWTSYAIPDVPETSNRGFLKLKVAVE